jgi:hypothetical protein
MTADIVWLRMPFKKGFIFREKEVPFLFKIMTLEMTCDDLGVEFGGLFSRPNAEEEVYEALIWNGYLAACKEMYKKPKYSKIQSIFWADHLSVDTRKKLVEEVRKLLGTIKDASEKMPAEEEKKKS